MNKSLISAAQESKSWPFEEARKVEQNYIDKYKNNVNFICVCSNIQKIIESIQSSLYIFKLYPLSEASPVLKTKLLFLIT